MEYATMTSELITHADDAEQSIALAQDIAEHLRGTLATQDRASIAFSGGNTPARMLRVLSAIDIDWQRIDITLVDERCVPESDPRSNAAMLRANLLDNLSDEPAFFPLYVPDETPEARGQRLQSLQRPFDVVHLGMGADAHTASFFPDAPNIGDMLDLQQAQPLLTTRSATSQEERLTWSLAALLQSRFFVLQISGPRKLMVLEDAMDVLEANAVTESARHQTPILAVLAESHLHRHDGIVGEIYVSAGSA